MARVKMTYKIAVIPGDGIGPEVMSAALTVLEAMEKQSGRFSFEFKELMAGDSYKARTGVAMTEETFEAVKASDACLFAAVGESAKDVIIPLRQRLNLYANIRPAKVYPNVPNVKGQMDMVMVRENTECLYKRIQDGGPDWGVALRVITRQASERIARYAFELARKEGRKKVTCVHKSNMLETTCGLFQDSCRKVAAGYKDIQYNEEIVDACAMKMIMFPERFDVMVTTNLFGDILSDLAAGIVGGLGLAPSANIGDKMAVFEPVHGSAPDIAGKGIANPIAQTLSAAMMLDWLDQKQASTALQQAVIEVLKDGKTLTPDLKGNSKTVDVAKAIIGKLDNKIF
jgi:3-isopropylmalate dehydrogenase